MLAVGLSTAAVSATDAPDLNPATSEDEEYVVGFYEMPRDTEEYKGEPVVDYDTDLEFFVVAPENPATFRVKVKTDDDVRYIHENHNDYELHYTPNDGQYSNQYGPQQTNTESAWDTTLGSTSVKLGLLDSGITADHEDFDATYVEGYDYVNDDGTPEDHNGCSYHGSHTAGTSAARTDNGVGIAGMSQSTIDMHKIFDSGFMGCGSASTSDIAQALKDHANDGAHISSNSWGGGSDQALLDAIDYANSNGVIIVAAAGNDGSCTDCVSDPWASRPSKVAIVSCTAEGETWCDFSSQGPEVDLAAPGNNVLSVDGGTTSGYQEMSGTSMSTPHVSGAVALYIDANGDVSHSTMEDELASSAQDVGLSSNRQGAGELDSGALVGSSGSPTASFTHTCDTLECQFDGSGSSDNGTIESYDWEFGDGTTATGEIVNHTYDAEGTYTVNLTVTDDDGNTDTDSQDVTVDDGTSTTLLFDGFEDGDLAEWALSSDSTNLWRAADDCVTPADGSWQMAFSRPASDCDYDLGEQAIGYSTSQTVDASSASTLTLDFDHFWETESYNGEYDVMEIHVSADGGSSWTTVAHWDSSYDNPSSWQHESYDISSYASSNTQVRFLFDSVDSAYNDYLGWYVDNVEIVEG